MARAMVLLDHVSGHLRESVWFALLRGRRSSTNCALDIWAAFISGQTTLMTTDSWVEDDSIESVATSRDIDQYCNLAILIFAKIVNSLATEARPDAQSCDRRTLLIEDLWSELQEWRKLRPREICPLLRCSPMGSNPFPTVVYTQSSSSR